MRRWTGQDRAGERDIAGKACRQGVLDGLFFFSFFFFFFCFWLRCCFAGLGAAHRAGVSGSDGDESAPWAGAWRRRGGVAVERSYFLSLSLSVCHMRHAACGASIEVNCMHVRIIDICEFDILFVLPRHTCFH